MMAKPNSSPEIESQRLHYRPDIDGLRATAVTAVIAYHAGIPFITGGFIGVDIFFVISGYLIGSIIYREVGSGTFSFSGFYARRARRILPALLTVVGLSLIAAVLLLGPNDLVAFSRSATATIFAVSNITFWLDTNYFTSAAELNPLLMTWSLGVEEQFYLLLPPLFLVVSRFFPNRLLLFAVSGLMASVTVSLWATGRYPTASFYLLPSRAWELGAGTVLGIFEIDFLQQLRYRRLPVANICSIAGLVLIIFSLLRFSNDTPFPGAAALVPVLATTLCILARDGWLNRKVLSATPATFVGRVSYSWYLWHWPMLSFARIITAGPLGLKTAASIALLSFVAAVLSWRYIEQPFRSAKGTRIATLRRYSVAVAIFGLLALAVGLQHGWPQRFDSRLTDIDRSGASLVKDPCLAGYGATSPNLHKECMPNQKSEQLVALVGDSHAAALAGALRELSKKAGLGLAEITKSSCPFLVGVSRRMPNHPSHQHECATFNDRVLAVLEKPTVKIVVLAGYWSAPFVEEAKGSRFVMNDDRSTVSPEASRKNLSIGLTGATATLLAHGKRVILVRDVPMYSFDPLRRVEATYIPLRRYLQPLLAFQSDVDDKSAPLVDVINDGGAANTILNEIEATFPNLTIIDPARSLCQNGRCSFADSSSVYYVDNQHLSLKGAQAALVAVDLTLDSRVHRSPYSRE